MPWDIESRDGKFCVINENGSSEGCHATRTEAETQMRALYASEPGAKELLGQLQETMTDIDEMTKDNDVVWVVKTKWDSFTSMLKDAFQKSEENLPDNRFMVWKEGDQWLWLAVYSNKFLDDDTPQEILSEAAHKEFVGAVDAGEWPMPDSWLWHVPGTKWGKATFLAYDERGFSIALGKATNAEVAEGLSQMEGLGVSHGMLKKELHYDPEDKRVIVRYRSDEISPLPLKAAANKLTSFSIDGGPMEVTKEKRAFLEELLDKDSMTALDAHIDTLSKEADGKEYKEEQEDDTEAAQAEAEPEVEEEVVKEESYVTEELLTEAMAPVISSFTEKFTELAEQINTLAAGMEEQVEAVKELRRDEDERLKEMVEATPAASLTARMLERATESKEAKIDGRSSLAKSSPKEATADGPTPIPWLNQQMAASRGGHNE